MIIVCFYRQGNWSTKRINTLVSGQTGIWASDFCSKVCVFKHQLHYSFLKHYPIRGSRELCSKESWTTLFKPEYSNHIWPINFVFAVAIKPSTPWRAVVLETEHGDSYLNTWLLVLCTFMSSTLVTPCMFSDDFRSKIQKHNKTRDNTLRVSEFSGSCSQDIAGPCGNRMNFTKLAQI